MLLAQGIKTLKLRMLYTYVCAQNYVHQCVYVFVKLTFLISTV